MEIPAPIVMIIASVVVVGMKFRSGRIKTWHEAVLASAVIVVVGLWFLRAERTANANAEDLVETLFHIDARTTPLVLRRHSSRGAPIAHTEAIYELSSREFDLIQGRPPALQNVSFKYQTGSWNQITVDRFNITADALDWRELPRRLRTAASYRVERGHHSRQRTPNERDMAGRYVCAFIPVDKEADGPAAPYDVLPCSAVRGGRPAGITILGLLNRNDHTLHVLIR